MKHPKRSNQTASSEGRKIKLSLEDVSPLFSEPISKAAKKLGLSESSLKRKCRELGVERWPHRRIKSMQESIERLETFGPAKNAQISQKVASLHHNIQQILDNPNSMNTLNIGLEIGEEATSALDFQTNTQHPTEDKTPELFLKLDVESVLTALDTASEISQPQKNTKVIIHYK
jgi:hypothetical protein